MSAEIIQFADFRARGQDSDDPNQANLREKSAEHIWIDRSDPLGPFILRRFLKPRVIEKKLQ